MPTRRKAGTRARPTRPDRRTLAKIERELRRVVRSEGPRLRRVEKWGNSWYAGRDLIVCIFAFSRHVGAEFWKGATLAETHPVLEGTGKNLRHLKLRSFDDVRSPAVRRLVAAAIRLDAWEPVRRR